VKSYFGKGDDVPGWRAFLSIAQDAKASFLAVTLLVSTPLLRTEVSLSVGVRTAIQHAVLIAPQLRKQLFRYKANNGRNPRPMWWLR
jgi:hypothetical protein